MVTFKRILKPVLIGAVLLGIFISFWWFQQDNIYSLDRKIGELEKKIEQISSVEERLKLKKDILGFEKDKTTIQNGAYTTLVQALGGLTLSITAWVGYQNLRVGKKNLEITNDKQLTERFSKSVEHLGSDKIDTRLGGIYALEQIANDASKYHWTIAKILSNFIRGKCTINDDVEITSNSPIFEETDVDVQAALTVLSKRKIGQYPQVEKIDLRRVKLSSVEIQGADLSGANLSETYLRGANLRGANLSGADLSRADLRGADLRDANLSRANLSRANLGVASLIGANLSGADMSYAVLFRASLNRANLSESKNLTQEQLYAATTDGDTKLPAHLKPQSGDLI